jgi:hypothetical protein
MLAAVATGTLLVGLTRTVAHAQGDLSNLVALLPTEAAECAFLAQLCRGAWASTGRIERTPQSREVLVDRQGAIAGARVDDAVAVAQAIERKRDRRLACFDREPCRGILPWPAPAESPPTPAGVERQRPGAASEGPPEPR